MNRFSISFLHLLRFLILIICHSLGQATAEEMKIYGMDCLQDFEGCRLNGGTCFSWIYAENAACICPEIYGGMRCAKYMWN